MGCRVPGRMMYRRKEWVRRAACQGKTRLAKRERSTLSGRKAACRTWTGGRVEATGWFWEMGRACCWVGLVLFGVVQGDADGKCPR